MSSGQAYGSGVYNYDDGPGNEIFFKQIELLNPQGEISSNFRADESITFRVVYQVTREISTASIAVMIMDTMGDHLWEVSEYRLLPGFI